jgi:lipopolysaccharide export system permease protein
MTTALALLLIIVLIYLSQRFIQFLAEAGAGQLPLEYVFKLLALKLLWVFVILIPLTFFLAILMSLGRLYSENEITAMFACGLGTPFLVQKIQSLAVFVAIIVGVLSFILGPWSEAKQEQLRQEIRQQSEVGALTAGRFQSFNQGRGIFYVEHFDKENLSMKNVFVSLEREGKNMVMSADRAYLKIEKQTNAKYIILFDGYRYDIKEGSLEITETKFAQHAILIYAEPQPLPNAFKSQTNLNLWESNQKGAIAELQMRFSAPLSILLLAPLAVLMSHTTPHQGRYSKIVISLLIYFIYINTLEISQKWVERDILPIWLGVWWVHGVLGIGILTTFLKREQH